MVALDVGSACAAAEVVLFAISLVAVCAVALNAVPAKIAAITPVKSPFMVFSN